MDEKKGKIVRYSFDFALRIINLYKLLTTEKKEFVISKQLLRSGTSVGAMVRESQNAESKADFIHKLGIAQKECDESLYWIELLDKSSILDKNEIDNIYNDATILLKMIKSAIITTKQSINKIHNQ